MTIRPRFTIAAPHSTPAERILLDSSDPDDARDMGVERTYEDHTRLVTFADGWFMVSNQGRSVDLNAQTARQMAEAILRAQGRA